MGRFEVEAFSGTVVKAVHSEGDVIVGDGIEAHFLWKELADQAVHVLVGTPFPGGIWMCEEEVSTKFRGDSFVLSELPTVVSRQRMDTSRKRRQQGNHGVRATG